MLVADGIKPQFWSCWWSGWSGEPRPTLPFHQTNDSDTSDIASGSTTVHIPWHCHIARRLIIFCCIRTELLESSCLPFLNSKWLRKDANLTTHRAGVTPVEAEGHRHFVSQITKTTNGKLGGHASPREPNGTMKTNGGGGAGGHQIVVRGGACALDTGPHTEWPK